jgi:glycosyltransferase involved in cell wall biosynthesis
MTAIQSTRTPDNAKLSLVIPVFNEQEGLPHVYPIINEKMESLGYPFEVVVSDNGSTDNTEAIMQDIAKRDARWKYVRLSRNFGYQSNISLGMRVATGDAIMLIDADLQDPPDMLRVFVEHWKQGYDVVYGVREKRTDEPRSRIFMTMLAMNFISWMSDYPLPPHSSDFRLIDKKVQAAFQQLDEASRYTRGMIHWIGYKQIGIPYTREGRKFDQENRKWGAGVLSLFNFMLDAIFSFSLKPLRLFSLLGGIIIAATVILSVIYSTLFLILGTDFAPPGWTTTTVILLLMWGTLSIGIGILGEYIGRIYVQSKQRPLWIIDYTLNFDGSPQPDPLPEVESIGE